MYNALFEIHRYKFRSEYPELWGHFEDEDFREKQKRKVESRLCFFAIRHAEDTESCGLIRVLFSVLEETVFWRVHYWLAKLTERIGRPWWWHRRMRQPTSPESPSAWWRPFGVFFASPVRTMPKPELQVAMDTSSVNRDEKSVAQSASCDPWSSEEYAARRKEATQFFARLFNRRALGYDNSQFYHGFRRPPWEKPTRSCHVLSRQRTEFTFGAGPLVSTNTGRRESRNVILFDCGTGETKPLLASVIDDYRHHPHRQFVVLRDKPGGPFVGRDEQPIEMHDYCRGGNTTSLITWMENHVNPTFSFAIASNRSARHGGSETPTNNNAPETVDLVDILGFKPRISAEAERLFASRRKHKGWAPLWEVGEIVRHREPAHTFDGVRLLRLSEGMALVSVNGAPFDKEAAERCVIRARQLGRGFRNPRQFDRVEAMCAIGFVFVGRGTVADQEYEEVDDDSRSRTWHHSTPAGRTGPMASSMGKQSRKDRYSLGDSIMTATDSGTTPDGIVLPGQRGVILREHRSTDEDSVNVVYFVRWDNHPTLGDSMIKQRRYRKGLPLDTLKDAVIKPVAELHLDCICAAEPTEDGWEEPVVVVGTGELHVYPNFMYLPSVMRDCSLPLDTY